MDEGDRRQAFDFAGLGDDRIGHGELIHRRGPRLVVHWRHRPEGQRASGWIRGRQLRRGEQLGLLLAAAGKPESSEDQRERAPTKRSRREVEHGLYTCHGVLPKQTVSNRPEFALYTPPVWASDLYKVYQALRVRIGRPLHERWMPWLFEQVADKLVSSDKLGLRGISLCKYIPGYIDSKARGTVECGAYRLTCRDLSDLWAEILIRNPYRADGITFANAE